MEKTVVYFAVDIDLDPRQNSITSLVNEAYFKLERSNDNPMFFFSYVSLPGGETRDKEEFEDKAEQRVSRRIGF